MFYTKENRRVKKREHTFIPDKPEYMETLVAGRKTLKHTGKSKNMYELTQSHKAEVDIENIIRAVALGDVRGLTQQEPQYIDATIYPTDYAEALRSIIYMENVFNSLPLNVRKEFNNNSDEFISEFGSEKFFKAVGIEKQKPAETFQPPKTEVEVKHE